MNPKNFQEMYLAELDELLSVETQMTESLGSFAELATDSALFQMIREHQDRTAGHRDRIAGLLKAHGEQPAEHSDGSMKALIAEADKWADMVEDDRLRDAGLVASLQRLEHYEIAVLGTLASWASHLGHDDDTAVLSDILEDDMKTDADLSRIAEGTVNRAAA